MFRLLLKLLGAQQRRHHKAIIDGKRHQLRRLFTIFTLIIVLHTLAMVVFEDMTWWQGVWLTLTSASTTGYGDISASTVYGQLATIILIYAVGISLLAQIASEYIEYRIELREQKLKGLWGWKDMQDHIVIINSPKYGAERYLKRLIEQINKEPILAELPIVLLSPDFPEGLPEPLTRIGLVHVTGNSEVNEDIKKTGIEKARYVLLLASDTESLSTDSINFDVITRVREMNSLAQMIVECNEDYNRVRFANTGANSVVRPVRAYPEIVVRAMAMPGSEQVLENMFTHEGDHTYRYNIKLQQMEWRDIVCKLMQAGFGTAMAYVKEGGKVDTNPKSSTIISCEALLVVVNDDEIASLEQIQHCLAGS